MNNKKKHIIAAAIIILLLLIDQAIKIAVKLNMNIGEEIVVFDWFRIALLRIVAWRLAWNWVANSS